MTSKKSGLEVPEASEPVKIDRPPRTYSLKQIMELKSESYTLSDKYAKSFGKLGVKSILVFRGAPKTGKSTYLLEFAVYLAETFGRVLYVFAEEAIKNNEDLKRRITDLGVDVEHVNNLRCVNTTNKKHIHHYVKRGGYRFVFIDSIQVCDFTASDLENWLVDFNKKKRLMWILVSQAKPILDFRHKATSIIEVTKYGKLSIASRSVKDEEYEYEEQRKKTEHQRKEQLSKMQGMLEM